MMTGYPQRYEYADGDYFICGVVVSVDEKKRYLHLYQENQILNKLPGGLKWK